MKKIAFKLIIIFFSISNLFSNSFGQSGIVSDSNFLSQQVKEYEAWLKSVELTDLLQISTYIIKPNKFTLVLTSANLFKDCDSFQSSWDKYFEDFNEYHIFKKTFPEKLLETLSVLTELHLDSLELIVRCISSESSEIVITGDKLGRVKVKDNRTEKQGNGNISVIPLNYRNINTGERIDSLARRTTCANVRNIVGDYLINHWYKGKGTKILYNFRCDTTHSSFYTEFTWEFTHLNNEVLKDQGFFEYHIIKIEVNDRNTKIDINWDFTSKFGSGILFPPKENDYKLTETYYKDKEDDYETKLFKNVEYYLNNKLLNMKE
jgi:hypothetical protein